MKISYKKIILLFWILTSLNAFGLDIDLDINGYYRTKFDIFTSLDIEGYHNYNFEDGIGEENKFLRASYFEHRLRLDPTLKITERISIHTQIDILKNSIFGYNESGTKENFYTYFPPSDSTKNNFFDTNPSVDALEVTRLWGSVNLSIGILKFGRIPFSWGMGIYRNSGDSLDSDFGTTIDGISFLTKPYGLSGNKSDTYFYIDFHKISEWDIYSGSDDINEWSFAFFKTSEDLSNLEGTPFWNRKYVENWFGLYITIHYQGDQDGKWTQSTNEGLLYTFDLFLRRNILNPIFIMTEWFFTYGEFDMVVPHPYSVVEYFNQPDAKILINEMKVTQFNGAVRLGWQSSTAELTLEYGYTNGVGENEGLPPPQILIHSQQVTKLDNPNYGNYIYSPPVYPQRHANGGHFNGDYNVDLILFEELMNLYTLYTPSPLDDTQTGVYDAQYIRLKAEKYFLDKRISLAGSIMYAWLTSNKCNFWGVYGNLRPPTYKENITGQTEIETENNGKSKVETKEFIITDLGDYKEVGRNIGLEIDGDLAYHKGEWFTLGLQLGMAFTGSFFDDLAALTYRYYKDYDLEKDKAKYITDGIIFNSGFLFTMQTRMIIHF